MIVGPEVTVPALRRRIEWGRGTLASLGASPSQGALGVMEERMASCPDGCSRQFSRGLLFGMRALPDPEVGHAQALRMLAAWVKTLDVKLEVELAKEGVDGEG